MSIFTEDQLASVRNHKFQNPEVEALMQDMEDRLLGAIGNREIRDMRAFEAANVGFYAIFVALDLAVQPYDKAQMELPLHD